MKNFTTRFALILSAFIFWTALDAQNMPNGVMPSVGDILQSVVAESDNITEGNSGNGVTWDFSVIQPMPLSEPTTSSYVNPDDTPFAAEFPTANLALSSVTSSGTFYSYYIKEGGTLQYIGGESAGNLSLYDQNPQLVLDENLSAGSVVTDDYVGYSDFTTTELFTTGVQSFDIDASGTLIMPSGTFDNAVRVVNINERVDSSGSATAATLIRLTSTIYTWYIPGQVEPLMSVTYSEGESEFTLMGMPPTITPIPLTKSVIYNPNPNIVNAIKAIPNQIEGLTIENIYPNPATNYINIKMNIEDAQRVQVIMTNVLGQQVSSEAISLLPGEMNHQLNVSNLSSGNYFLSIVKNNEIVTRKITKE